MCVWIWGLDLSKALLPFLLLLLYWGIPLSYPTSGIAQKRAGCSIVSPLEFQSCLIVFSAGHLTPPLLFFQHPLYAHSLFASSIIPPNQIQGVDGGGVGYWKVDEGRIGKFVIGLKQWKAPQSASRQPGWSKTPWSHMEPPDNQITFSLLFSACHICLSCFYFLKEITAGLCVFHLDAGRTKIWPNSSASNDLMK